MRLRSSITGHRRLVAAGGAAALLGATLVTGAVASSAASAAPAQPGGLNPIVATDDGKVRGTLKAQYAEYKGIPYAAAPVGDLRWKAPQAPEPWKGVRDATSFGGSCTQGTGWDPGYETPTNNEDCLNLNVYVPANAKGKLPVMF